MRFGSLFSGIGGLDLGLERAGMSCAWQVEINPYAQRVLKKHWPEVRRFGDITTINTDDLDPVDLICGGFPCQPHSIAGKRSASADSRDLWSEYVRVLWAVRPRWIVAENVPGILSSEKGEFFGQALRDLADLGYDAEWESLPAIAFGAPHIRYRVFLVAYPHGTRLPLPEQEREALGPAPQSGWWATEPRICRVAHGVPKRVDRLKVLGNAVVPQVAEWVGRRIMRAEALR